MLLDGGLDGMVRAMAISEVIEIALVVLARPQREIVLHSWRWQMLRVPR